MPVADVLDVLPDGVPVLGGVDAPDGLHRQVLVEAVAAEVGETVIVSSILSALQDSQLLDLFDGVVNKCIVFGVLELLRHDDLIRERSGAAHGIPRPWS